MHKVVSGSRQKLASFRVDTGTASSRSLRVGHGLNPLVAGLHDKLASMQTQLLWQGADPRDR